MRVWSRIFALGYDPFFWGLERAGFAKLRARLLGQARGRVLELGAGTGLNARHYPTGVDVVFTEPDEAMASRFERVTGRAVVRAGAESLPFAAASFDTVVSTLVLCTVGDVTASLAEVRRVLAPGGRLLILEHVRGDDGSGLGRWQDRLHRPWHAFACGCNTNRRTVDALARAGFDVSGLTRLAPPPFTPPMMRPIVVGALALADDHDEPLRVVPAG